MQDPELAVELLAMAERDGRVRAELVSAGTLHGGYHPKMRQVHRESGERLTEILNELGCWPGRRIVGIEGSQAAWLIAQHDIAHPPLLRRSLALLRQAVADGEAAAQDLAFLTDRVRSLEGRQQLYGTQRDWGDDGKFGVWPAIENRTGVDERRRAVGLAPLRLDERSTPLAPPATQKVLTAGQVADWRQEERAFAESVGWRPASAGIDRCRPEDVELG